MRRCANVAFLLLAACGYEPPLFETQCGLRFLGGPRGPGGWTRQRLQIAENESIKAMAGTSDTRLMTPWVTCNKLDGVDIVLDESMPDTWNAYTSQRYRRVHLRYILTEDSSLTHELMHVVQDFTALNPPSDGEDSQHANWKRDGLRFAEWKGMHEYRLYCQKVGCE